MFDTILFPVDFSKRCEAATPSVAAYAREFQSRVVLVHVVESPDFLFGMPEYSVVSYAQIRGERIASLRTKLDQWGLEEFKGIFTTRLIVEGGAALQICDVAQTQKASLIMMPSHGAGPFRRFVIGSTTAKVLHDSIVPVWSDVHAETEPPEAVYPLKSVVCALDCGPHSEDALRMASGLARQSAAGVTIVHAIPAIEVRPVTYFDTEFSAQLTAEARERIAEVQKKLGTNYRVCVHGGDPAEVVRQAAEAHDANLVVIARGAILGGLGRLRTHAYSIVNKSPVPVLSV